MFAKAMTLFNPIPVGEIALLVLAFHGGQGTLLQLAVQKVAFTSKSLEALSRSDTAIVPHEQNSSLLLGSSQCFNVQCGIQIA